MQIILVSSRLSKARSVEVSKRHVVLGAVLLLGAVLASASVISYLALRKAAELRLPFVQSLAAAAQADAAERSDSFLKANLQAMAARVGEMQAQLLRLDVLGERLAASAGVKVPELRGTEIRPPEAFAPLPGRGGPLVVAPAGAGDRLGDLQRRLDELARQMEAKSDHFGILESQIAESRVRHRLLPSLAPVDGRWNASGFGWRIDPITGQHALHEGIDFIADVGTPIHAAAGGVVVSAEFHPQYGYMVEIDHGNELTTRYAHCSRMHVKPGDVVHAGKKIAEVGSTGRSTGPHLHFEVRSRGVALNPARFLQSQLQTAAR
ncbi:MAG: M23 family metallopeptidase [Burkholderiales bacterium]|nr:M23 family metallopeptidase [Burkholderiales bacterium]